MFLVGEASLQMENYDNIFSSKKELRRKSMYIQKTTQGLIAPGYKHGKKLHQYQKRCSLDIPNQFFDEKDTDSLNSQLLASKSVNSIINHVQEKEKDEVGRVAGWAVNFDKLLLDLSGLRVFTEFLRKEFSEENIIFWMTVEKYKQITSQEMRNVQAKEIFNKHLSMHASEPVNIDSIARQQADSQLDTPTPQIFDVAQHQIYQLMKQDCYARFLKSELYKTCLFKEMEGKQLDIPQEENKNGKETDEKEKQLKMTEGEENEDKGKRRRSLLPWRQKASKSSMKLPSDDGAKNSKEKDKERKPLNLSKDTPMFGCKEAIMKKRVLFWIDLPNKKSVDVKDKPTRMIRVVLKPILHKYGFKMDGVDMYLSGHTAVLDLEGLVSSLDNQRVVVVPRDDCPGYQKRRSSLIVFIERVHRKCSKGSDVNKHATKEEQSQKTLKQWVAKLSNGKNMLKKEDLKIK
ncbi:hypothetical protein CHS0354_009917 [Potamilus streckersoni]|uniref:Uncharacterized protein n=1 Tax=Potamilus streckersoni TaxID=2493646 RepID=A0AAE0WB06_9BIVA|nr:hypothetical protein CHS0354_009917 [Potamilus streckersoni]